MILAEHFIFCSFIKYFILLIIKINWLNRKLMLKQKNLKLLHFIISQFVRPFIIGFEMVNECCFCLFIESLLFVFYVKIIFFLSFWLYSFSFITINKLSMLIFICEHFNFDGKCFGGVGLLSAIVKNFWKCVPKIILKFCQKILMYIFADYWNSLYYSQTSSPNQTSAIW